MSLLSDYETETKPARKRPHDGATGLAWTRAGSVPQQGQDDLGGDEQDDDDLEHFGARAAGLFDKEVEDVADGVELAADVLFPLVEVEAVGGELEDAGEVLVADELE